MSDTTHAYAWMIKADDDPFGRWVLCSWAAPSVEVLERDGKPSPEALAVRVTITPTRKSVRKRLAPASPAKKMVREYREHVKRKATGDAA